MKFEIKKAERRKVKLKIGLAGPAGSGKTYSALLMAYGLVADWEKICVIDTENGSAALYDHLGPYNVLDLSAPFSPDKYIQALQAATQAGMECVIIDSMSHEWTGAGGALDWQAKLGGRFQDWAKVTPEHRKFIDAILHAPIHVIGTLRTKTEWAIETGERGKPTVRRLGTKVEQREGVEYEWTVAWRLLPESNLAVCEKDRTGLWSGKPETRLSEEIGHQLRQWYDSAKDVEEAKPKFFSMKAPDQLEKLVAWCRKNGITEVEQIEGIAIQLDGQQVTELHRIAKEVINAKNGTEVLGGAVIEIDRKRFDSSGTLGSTEQKDEVTSMP